MRKKNINKKCNINNISLEKKRNIIYKIDSIPTTPLLSMRNLVGFLFLGVLNEI